MIDKDDILTKPELAERLKCHINSITNWERAGKITGHRMGRRVYFKGSEVLASLGIDID